MRRTLGLCGLVIFMATCAGTNQNARVDPTKSAAAQVSATIAYPTIAVPTAMPEQEAWAAVRRSLPPEVLVFRPGWLPDRFRGAPPVVEFAYFQGAEPIGRYRVGYRDPQGKVVLLAIGPVNSGPPLSTEPTTVHGLPASLTTNSGFPWIQVQWTERDAPYSVQATGLTREELLRVTAELQPVAR